MPSLFRPPRLVVLVALGLHVAQSSIMNEGFGFKATTDVSDVLDLALDIKAMRDNTSNDVKKTIYTKGTKGEGGPSLQKLSTEAATRYGGSPLFNLYRAGYDMLGTEEENDLNGNFDGVSVDLYADTIVNDLFDLDVIYIESEAALAMNVAMAFWGSLWNILEGCKGNDATKMNRALDEAAAFWVGAGQVKGDGQTGYFFYNLAQFVGSKFNQASGDSEVRVNRDMIGTLLSVQGMIANGTCGNTGGYKTMRDEINKMAAYLNRVLVQMLIHRVETINPGEDTDLVELYTLALLPQIGSCNPDAYYRLIDLTVEDNVSAETQEDVLQTLQSVFSCLHITCEEVGSYEGNRVPACNDNPTEFPAIAGFTPKNDVRGSLYIDRDVRQIRWIMHFGAIEAARDIYLYGWNAEISLSQIATDNFNMLSGDEYDDFGAISTFYDDLPGRTFDSIIGQIFDKVSPYSQATDEQRAGMIDGFMRGSLMYLATTSALNSAIFTCSQNDLAASQRYLDQAVAFFVGSTEGSGSKGAQNMPGDSLWGLGDKYCEEFSNCEPNDAQVNERLMGNFKGASDAVGSQACDILSSLYSEEIRPSLLVALIQGTLYNYVQWSNGVQGGAAGYVFSFSRILLPLFARGASSAGDAIEGLNEATDWEFTNSLQPQTQDVNEVFAYFTDILQAFPTDCRDIGAIQITGGLVRQVCPGEAISAPPIPAPPVISTPSPTMGSTPEILAPTRAPAGIPKDPVTPHPQGIAWGRYQFSNQDVANNDARFSLDVKQMYISASTSDATTAYNSGTSVPGTLHGTSNIRTLASLSTEAPRIMGDDILHNFYLYALYDDVDFDNNLQGDVDPWPYGDDVVSLALDSQHGDSTKLAAEAVMVMNVFMMIVHQMYQAGRQCLAGTADAPVYVDSAVALWIGLEQGEAMFDTGYSLYGIAQEVYKYYGNEPGEAPANTALMTLFNTAQATARRCDGDEDEYAQLRAQTDLIIKELSKPMMQMLLYYLSVEDTNFAELYSLAFVPQVITCNIDEFGELRDSLFQGSIFDADDTKKLDLLENLAGGFACLRYTCADLGDVSQADESLRIIVNDLCEDLVNDYDQDYLASYQITPEEDRVKEINELARLDLDLLQISILMRANALRNAQEIFDFGRNSREPNFSLSYGLKSWKSVAKDEINQKAADTYSAYQNFGRPFGGSLVAEVFEGRLYENANRSQKAAIVARTIQTTVSFIAIVARLRESINVCNQNAAANSGLLVDEAAALFVGSIEGSKSGGSSTGSGTMLMALGKEVCASFDTCATQGDAAANEFIMFAFSDMKEWFDSNDCDSAENIMSESLLPMLPVSIIQATIKYAYDAKLANPQDEDLSTVAALSESIVPLVKVANTTSADTLDANLGFDPNRSPVPEGPDVIVDAFANALRRMDIECNAVGTYSNSGLSVCKAPEVIAPHPDTPTNLGDDKYTSTTYVDDRAGIAKDVEQMRSSLSIGNVELAREIYRDGENSPVFDDEGKRVATRSLKRFSTESKENMKWNPIYQTAVFALQDGEGNYKGAPASQYADTIVQESFNKGGELAADAAVALNLWMEASNELFQMLRNCRYQRIKDDDGIHSIDEAAAYWIGDASTDDTADHGHLLYALTESMAVQFGTVGRTGQATANRNILQLLQAAKLELSYPDACSEDITTVRRVRHLTNQAISQMMVPMVQALIHYIINSKPDQVRVYAHAVVPHLAACGRTTFDYLSEKLITKTYGADEEDDIVLALQASYGCLGLTCFDIGTHRDSQLDIDCEDIDIIEPLSGFRTRTDAGEYAKLDLDIEELDILMAMEAYEAAEELYRFGRHAQSGDDGRVSLSLQTVATDTGRTAVPDFVAFEQFFGNDANYADTMISKLFNPLNSPKMNPIHRRHVVVATAQYVVMVMGALHAMQSAMQECLRDSDGIGASQYWDRAAAYIIGHMEGPDKRGSKDGRLVWGLAKKECAEWGTCSATVQGNAVANERILSLLYTGRGALTSGSCKGVQSAISELRIALRVPLIQGTISAIVRTSESTGAVKEVEHAKAHALANSILPLIAAKNKNAAITVQSNLDFEDEPLSSGLTKVVDAITATMSGLGVDCGDVGSSAKVDSCSGKVSSGPSVLLIIVIVALTIATLGLGLVIYRKRKTKTKEAPVFVPNEKGELSHNEVIGNGSPSRSDAQEMVHGDADAAHEDDFEHAELPETV